MKGLRRCMLILSGALATAASGQDPLTTVSSISEREAARAPLTRPISLVLSNVTLRSALDAIAAKGGVHIQYQSVLINDVTLPVSIRVQRQPLRDVLDQVLSGTGLQVEPVEGILLAIIPKGRNAQVIPPSGVIVGKVVHARTRQPISGAMVQVGEQRVATGTDGSFRVPSSSGEKIVHVRAVGFVRQSRTVLVFEEESRSLEFALEPSASVLNEVVVTGTVVETERKAIATPITVITADEIEKRGITRIEQFFRGEVPGVVALEQGILIFTDEDPAAMSKARVYSRGASHMEVGKTPSPLKTYVDGVELVDAAYLGGIDPKSIERIEIITGPQAATVYGSGAFGGVMQIFTKKGKGLSSKDIRLTMKYGTLQSNFSSGLTPIHNDAIHIAGGTGSIFTYSGTLSYAYTGQWQPNLFREAIGGQLGAVHTAGRLTANGSLSVTAGRSGTYNASRTSTPFYLHKKKVGEWRGLLGPFSPNRSKTFSQVAALTSDYRVSDSWVHTFNLGLTRTDFSLGPQAPIFADRSDTLLTVRDTDGKRVSYGYNTSFKSTPLSTFSSSVTVGVTGASGEQISTYGCLQSLLQTQLVDCGYLSLRVDRLMNSHSIGGFGSWQLGFFDKVFLTFGGRAERNRDYGKEHRIDWTPTVGIAYTIEKGNSSAKLMASYGKATRAPDPSARLDFFGVNSSYTPSGWKAREANNKIRPEVSGGVQGGLEVYIDNLASFTLNYYQQRVKDLIQSVVIDSLLRFNVIDGSPNYASIHMWMNVGSLKQYGLESSASLSLGALSLRGTWSWNESEIADASALWRRLGLYPRGGRITGVPSHTGSLAVGYSFGGTSLTATTALMGKIFEVFERSALGLYQHDALNQRLAMYSSRAFGSGWPSAGSRKAYNKTDLAFSQRLTSWSTATLTVVNLGNSYDSDVSTTDFALGRQTSLGVSWRLF